MSLNLLTRRESVLAAIGEFDEIGQQAFLDKYGYRPAKTYFLDHDGRRYDFKAIVGVAIGKEHPDRGPLRSDEFSGGDATVRAKLEDLGFRVVRADTADIPSFVPTTPPTIDSFRDALIPFLKRFGELREQRFGADDQLKSLGEKVAEVLRRFRSVEQRPQLQIEWSVGKGNWASVPWVALMDRRETTTTRQGLYVVFLIAEDLSMVYLTLSQGTTTVIEAQGRAAGSAQLRARAEAARAQIRDLGSAGFLLDDNISLAADGWRARSYQAGVIAHMALSASDLPDDVRLESALEAVLSAYEQLRVTGADVVERPVWFVGATWDGVDQTSRFLAEGIWENGWKEGPTTDVVRQMRPGDRIAVKAAYTRKKGLPFPFPEGQAASVMRLKATGVITANAGDGRRVEVAWSTQAAHRDWYFFTNQTTIWRVTPDSESASRLIAFAFDGAPQDYAWFLNKYGAEPADDVPDSGSILPTEIAPDPIEPYTLEHALDGLFMGANLFCRVLRIWSTKKNLILQGPPGVGKSFVARRLAFALMEEKAESRLAAVQFHQSYGYEDFIQGFRPTPTGGFVLRDGVFLRFCRRALADPERKHVFIIDEINRANLSKVFGELMLLIEHDKRSPQWRTRLAYASEEEPELWLPENLYILGMMNTADRSLSLVDYALRRRFAFVALEPAFESPAFAARLKGAGVPQDLVEHVRDRMRELNTMIAHDTANLGPGFRIGHSFFVPSDHFIHDAGWLEQIVETEIRPLLSEYWFDDPKKAEARCARLLERS